MEPKQFRSKRKPETIIQNKIIKMLRDKEWLVKATHGSKHQSGFPDLYATHRNYGIRWIEVKVKGHFSFTQAQREWFPLFSANGTRIWILVSDSEMEYNKLFGPANWHAYLQMKG